MRVVACFGLMLSASVASVALAATTAPVTAAEAAPVSASTSALAAIAQRQATPEAATGRYPLSVAKGRRAMVVTAHPLATEAALAMLRAGGSAADAAVAAQAVLGLIEPQSSGFGGGGFLLYARRGEVTAIDGRETAPAAATPSRFLNADNTPMRFNDALARARAVGIPGAVAALAEAHQRWGRLPWATLLAPAIRLAEHGAPVSDRLSRLSAQDALLAKNSSTASYFLDASGRAWPAGTLLKNPAYAQLLRQLAKAGPKAFYQGKLAASFVAQLQAAGSDITLDDWQGYRATVSPALCRPLSWHSALQKPAQQPAKTTGRICSAPPPSGGLTVLENILLMAQANSALPLDHVLLEAERLAFADRQRYSADPAFVPVPADGLLSPAYLQTRAALIGEAAAGTVAAGIVTPALAFATDKQVLEHGTSHFAIVDARGHWLAMTSSIEDAFGSRLMINGVMMNNQLTDFSFSPEQDGLPVANRVAAGKRPRSAMSPTLLLNTAGEPVLSVGSPGGSRIIGFNTGVIARWLAGEHDAGALVSAPHALNRNGITELENGFPTERRAELAARGHDIRDVDMASGLGVIVRDAKGLQGAADPRREGRAAGY
ncbi:MAG: gamma-glutamyltransferase family protein [Pseudomonadota bacterium]